MGLQEYAHPFNTRELKESCGKDKNIYIKHTVRLWLSRADMILSTAPDE
jgi:hypothetical protein